MLRPTELVDTIIGLGIASRKRDKDSMTKLK